MATSARRRHPLFALLGSLLILLGLIPVAPVAAVGRSVFINEIHYDNSGADTGEFIEIAGPAGTDLTGWSIVLYNGNGGSVYRTDALTVTIDNEGGSGYGAAVVNYPADGIQNGSPDGIALVNASAQVVQFLSYEGTMTAVGGPADGTTSVDIPVIEDGTAAAGLSIGLTGTGLTDSDFVWTTGLNDSPGLINPGQTFSTGDPAPSVVTSPANGATGVPTNTTPSITFSEPVTFGPTGPSPDPLTLVCTNQGTKSGTLNDAGDADPATYQFVVAPFLQGDHCVLTIKAANVSDLDTDDPPDAMAADHVAAFDIFAPVVTPDLVINEIDYDQPGTDFAEFVEIRNDGASAVNLDAVQVDLVNGTGGGAAIYQTVDLPNVSLAAGDYFVICGNPSTTPNCDLDGGSDTALLQNGDPDAVGLRVGATVFDAISYVGNTGAPYTEGSGGAPDDPQVDFRSLSRCPDGADTDANNVDVVVRTSTPGTVNACLDDGPVASATAPANGDFGVDPGTDIAITFSEAVNVSGSWFSIVCTSSGAHSAAVVGGPVTFGLNPAVDFTNAESCTVTILAAGVTDQDATDPPDNMPFDHSFTFTIVAPSGCDLAASHQIWEVQGSGGSSPVAGQQVRVEGVVTGDFQGATALNGFFIQDDTPDADPSTSDGIFVFSNIEVAEGDLVRASGTAIEFNGLTELSPVTAVDICGTGTIAPATHDLPRPVGTTFEPVEGVLVTFPEALTATEHFQLGRFGEVTVSSDGRLFQPTDRVAPGAPAQALAEEAARRRLLIDDGSTVQNPAFVPYLTPEAVRIGDTATGITGVMSFGFNLYRLQPTETITFARTNPRPPAPANVGGDVQVASFNTLNYFTTLANDNPNARGANNATEFQRQQAKEVAAILGIDADILGLMEVENNGSTAIASLVNALNAAAGSGTYAYITEPALNAPNEFGGTFGTDAIKVAIIYKPAVVAPVGAAQTSADSIFDRPPLIQQFQRTAGSESVTVVVNHFKSKNCGGAAGLDLDQGDGQSCFNARRVAQAEKLVEVLDALGTPNTLVIGDLNSYTEEDPIHVLEDAGYAGLSEAYLPDAARYSFVFDGLSGELDHGLAAAELVDNVTGATIWHINADEPLILDYNTEFNPPGLYQPDAYRTSDHDPLIIGLDLDLTLTPIHAIQGAAHVSPIAGSSVNTSGVVTGLSTTTTLGRGFYIQDPNPDADIATSEAIFVFTSTAPTVSVGDSVLVSGLVAEFRPGGASSNNLTKTQLTNPIIEVQSTGNPLPAATIVGLGGRVPPTTVIDDDATGSVETSGSFDATTDGIDFYESLEAMRVQVNNPVVVGPTTSNREIFVLADDGAGAALRTYRGGIIVRPTDFNPERIQLDDTLLANSTPNASVGDHFNGPAVGIVDYNFSSFEVNLTSGLTTVSAGLAREVATAPGANELVMATYNVENLTVGDPQSKFDSLANQIVNNLLSPDVIALEEIQDNNGVTGGTTSSVVDADQTLARLIAAIDAADPAPGPVYDYRQINPVAHQDGGAPGGNIRVGFLFRTDRGLTFVDRPGGTPTAATTIVNNGGTPELSFSPGRVAPNDAAWLASRKPLAGEFTYRGQTFFLIANHFNSKSADQPLFGRFQPPNRTTEVQRHQQAQLVNDFVDAILAVDANANIVVLGDINDFEFSETVDILTAGGTVLHDLMDGLPADQRYSYVFEGNSQVLDHIIVSSSLLATAPAFDPVHINAEYFDQVSDHDPSVALFVVNDPPTVDAGGPYTVVEGSSVTVTATGSDPNGDLPLTYAWDLDNNGSFETPGQSATFNAPAGSAPASPTIRVRVTDSTGLTAIDTATVNIIWSFSGFQHPLVNPPTENIANAGSGVPIKFSLAGEQGLSVIAAGYPKSIQYTCGAATRPLDGGTSTSTTPTGGFIYDADRDTYTYNWKTAKSWSDTCRRFILKLTDGTFHYVDFHFVK